MGKQRTYETAKKHDILNRAMSTYIRSKRAIEASYEAENLEMTEKDLVLKTI